MEETKKGKSVKKTGSTKQSEKAQKISTFHSKRRSQKKKPKKVTFRAWESKEMKSKEK